MDNKSMTNLPTKRPMQQCTNQWCNQDNVEFYENVDINYFINNSELGGLAKGEDLILIHEYLQGANSILEVGAGHGRVIEYILNHYPTIKISAIEYSLQFCHFLKEKFSEQIKLYPTNILNFKTTQQFDLILWMFAGISDFSPEEQQSALKNLNQHLKKSGVFIIEAFPCFIKPNNAVYKQEHFYTVKMEKQIAHGYLPSSQEILQYAKEANLKLIKYLPYQTSTGRKRLLYFFGKEN